MRYKHNKFTVHVPTPKVRTDVMPSKTHGKQGKAATRNERRTNNAKLRRGDYDA